VEDCLECRRLELDVKNLEEAVRMGKLRAFTGNWSLEQKNREFELLLQLTDDLEIKRREYKQHRKTHFAVH
jgi:hypothetical protein